MRPLLSLPSAHHCAHSMTTQMTPNHEMPRQAAARRGLLTRTPRKARLMHNEPGVGYGAHSRRRLALLLRVPSVTLGVGEDGILQLQHPRVHGPELELLLQPPQGARREEQHCKQPASAWDGGGGQLKRPHDLREGVPMQTPRRRPSSARRKRLSWRVTRRAQRGASSHGPRRRRFPKRLPRPRSGRPRRRPRARAYAPTAMRHDATICPAGQVRPVGRPGSAARGGQGGARRSEGAHEPKKVARCGPSCFKGRALARAGEAGTLAAAARARARRWQAR